MRTRKEGLTGTGVETSVSIIDRAGSVETWEPYGTDELVQRTLRSTYGG